MGVSADPLRGYVEYLRDLGIYDFYRCGEPRSSELEPVEATALAVPAVMEPVPVDGASSTTHVGVGERPAALDALRAEIGDCTRCPLAYAGRRTIVFGNGDPGARLMFVGGGPGAEDDAAGEPFVGKAGQLLNNMIQAMGLRREQVYVTTAVKCRTPAHRAPEPVEAGTCLQFLERQVEIVQPRVIVALGATAAASLLGKAWSLSELRGVWHECRGAKVAVTYEPNLLLQEPRLKGEAWKDLQRVMEELGLTAPRRS